MIFGSFIWRERDREGGKSLTTTTTDCIFWLSAYKHNDDVFDDDDDVQHGHDRYDISDIKQWFFHVNLSTSLLPW